MMNYDEFKQKLTTVWGNEFLDVSYQPNDNTFVPESSENTGDTQEHAINISYGDGDISTCCIPLQRAVYKFDKELKSKELDLDKIELFVCNVKNFNCDECPHFLFHDIVVYMRYVISRDNCCLTSTKVTYGFLSYFGVTWDSIFPRAFINTFAQSWGIQNTATLLGYEEENKLYVLTYPGTYSYGGALIMHQDAIEQIYKQLGPFYLIPSSIHELMVIPASAVDDVDMIHRMMLDINCMVVKKEEVLSSHLFYFNGDVLEVAR